ncbi:MAG: alanine:cation symporter family protein [Bacteriovoracaceae bacterium]|jgi:AGCS family alanine or glycine:cation symporter|nr:alanine:cation symporter family protein [Bacteriovoracaceae bacterium]
MLDNFEKILAQLVNYIWGLPTIALLITSGLFLSFILGGLKGGIQFKAFFHGLQVIRGKYDHPDDPGEISHFQALMTALSATIGLGNIGIVAIIIKLGGPGAIFWMILAGIIGMATKYAESTLAILFRKIDKDGTVHGGPMYYIEKGLGKQFKPMAKFYAFSIAIGSFGIANMFQTNQSAVILNESFGIPYYITGLVMMVLAAIVIIGGIKRIAKVTSLLVPIMAISYIIGCFIIIGHHIDQVPELIILVIKSAFSDTAIAGGAIATMHMAIAQGIKRACFSNEAGLGSAAIAHSAAATKEPVREGVVALLGPFIDTVLICTLTALVILTTGVWEVSDKVGVPLTAQAFDSVISGFGHYFIPIAATLFAFSTLISWSYYGQSASYYLFGKKGVTPFKIIFCGAAFLGSIWKVQAVLDFSDIMTGLMIFPNLVAIWLLLPHLKKQTNRYFTKLENNEFHINNN